MLSFLIVSLLVEAVSLLIVFFKLQHRGVGDSLIYSSVMLCNCTFENHMGTFGDVIIMQNK